MLGPLRLPPIHSVLPSSFHGKDPPHYPNGILVLKRNYVVLPVDVVSGVLLLSTTVVSIITTTMLKGQIIGGCWVWSIDSVPLNDKKLQQTKHRLKNSFVTTARIPDVILQESKEPVMLFPSTTQTRGSITLCFPKDGRCASLGLDASHMQSFRLTPIKERISSAPQSEVGMNTCSRMHSLPVSSPR